MLMKMQICTFFNTDPDLTWREQLTPLIGLGEVDRLEVKLKGLNVTDLDYLQVPLNSLFPSPPAHLEDQFDALLMDIGSWPQVRRVAILLKSVQKWCYIQNHDVNESIILIYVSGPL